MQHLNTQLALGQPIDLSQHPQAVSAMVRVASRLGLQRRARDVLARQPSRSCLRCPELDGRTSAAKAFDRLVADLESGNQLLAHGGEAVALRISLPFRVRAKLPAYRAPVSYSTSRCVRRLLLFLCYFWH